MLISLLSFLKTFTPSVMQHSFPIGLQSAFMHALTTLFLDNAAYCINWIVRMI